MKLQPSKPGVNAGFIWLLLCAPRAQGHDVMVRFEPHLSLHIPLTPPRRAVKPD
ncbi:hypothetical protein [Sulfitobacter sp. SK012]|uniref:hypothetical protein n=1 Tax=Sulfitobacter sp. SK012 TaxID=1389005 RepID=UPI0013B43C4A|nr:hypothetical protein [Sulfitobacter sp. SK012]